MSKWYETLEPDRRERLFAWMRSQDEKSQAYARDERSRTPTAGRAAVGAGFFDPFLSHYVIDEFLSALRRGENPEQAQASTDARRAEAIRIHNSRRPKQMDWQRWEGSQSDRVAFLYSQCRLAVG